MKRKMRIFWVVIFNILFITLGISTPQSVIAQEARSIFPYFSAYVEEGEAQITAQKTLYDFTDYDAKYQSKIKVSSEYTLTQGKTTFVYPVIAKMEELDRITVTANGKGLTPEKYFGGKPQFVYGKEMDVEGLLGDAYPSKIEDGKGVLYLFENTETPLEISITRAEGQSVFHSGCNYLTRGNKKYSLTLNDNKSYPYRIFATQGALPYVESNAAYTTQEMTYTEALDFYADELVSFTGTECVRDYIYSRFNKYKTDSFTAFQDLTEGYADRAFCLLKFAVPATQGEGKVVVNSFVEPTISASPAGQAFYGVWTVTPYSAQCDYTLEIKLSAILPYMVESDLNFENNVYAAQEIKKESYFIVSPQEYPQEKVSHNEWLKYVLIGVLAVGAVITLTLSLLSNQLNQKKR